MAKLSDTSRFKADKGFRGTEAYANAGPRSDPVQFERPNNSSNSGSDRNRDRSDRYDGEDDEPVANKRSRR